MTSYLGVFAADITVQHQVWNDTGANDGHGNAASSYATAVARKVIAIYPRDKQPKRDKVNSEYVERIVIDFVMQVPDASLYSKNDIITWDGLDYLVEGFPWNWANGNPFGIDQTMFGGSVNIVRVT